MHDKVHQEILCRLSTRRICSREQTNTDDISSQSHSLFACSREKNRQVENRLYKERSPEKLKQWLMLEAYNDLIVSSSNQEQVINRAENRALIQFTNI